MKGTRSKEKPGSETSITLHTLDRRRERTLEETMKKPAVYTDGRIGNCEQNKANRVRRFMVLNGNSGGKIRLNHSWVLESDFFLFVSGRDLVCFRKSGGY